MLGRVTDSIQFALLGPLQATRAGRPLDLGPRRQCALLSVLLCQPNRATQPDALLRGVWDDEVPASGQRLISTYVYRLRRVLGGAPEIVRTRDGYQLRVAAAELDTVQFAAAVERSREQRAQGCLAKARATLSDALALWRGEPFAGLPGPVLAAERVRLEEGRLTALEQRAELDLRCGDGDLGACELRALRVRYPLRERLAALLMIALYRTGRQAEALSVYTDTDTRLRAELGVQPGRELAEVHRAVLCDDEEALGELGGQPVRAVGAASAHRRDDLPAGPPVLAGRTRELAALTENRPDRPEAAVTAVDGMPGVGKTALVLRAAARLRPRHPGGRFYLDLRAHRPGHPPMYPDEALRRLLTAAGHALEGIPDEVEERAAMWRDTAADRGVLLVLDDADCTAQVRPLLPSAAGCTVLVAGRRRLPALPAGRVLSLPPLGPAEGRDMLAGVLGHERLGREADAVRELVRCCGGLPALLAGVAGRLRHRRSLTVADVLARLRRPGGLLRIARADGRGDSWLDPSWLRLGDGERQALRRLVAGAEEPARLPDAVTDSLVDANLLEETVGGRPEVHPLIAAYVAAQPVRLPVGTGSIADEPFAERR